jgi:phage terminase small subunit
MATKATNNQVLTVIDTQRLRLKAPSSLKPGVRTIFEHVVNNSAPTHFKENEAPLLALYCSALHLARFYCEKIGDEGDKGQNSKLWNENAKLAMGLAVKLRLCPSSRFDGRAMEKKAHEPNYEADEAPWND